MAILCPTGHHWGGTIEVFNIVRIDKKTGERTVVERNLRSDNTNGDRRCTELWKEHSKAAGFDSMSLDLNVFFDTETVGWMPVDPEKAKSSPKWKNTCPVCGLPCY